MSMDGIIGHLKGISRALNLTGEEYFAERILMQVEELEKQAALQSGAGDGWSGWAVQYPNKLPYLYGAKEIALLNYDPESDARLIYLMEAIDNAQATEGE